MRRRLVYSLADELAAIIRDRPSTDTITLSPAQHHELYATMPGVKLPYYAHDWSRETLVFQGVEIHLAPVLH